MNKPETEENVALFQYQKDAIAWLHPRKVALLALEMGLGKSAVAITAADRANCERILVICPRVASLNWLREFAKFSKRNRDFTLVQTSKDKIPAQASVIVSYNLAAIIPREVFGKFDAIIIDEVHMAKSTSAKRTHAVLGSKGLIHEQKPTTKIWALSGTPCPNDASEIWTLLYSFGRTRLNFQSYIERFCVLSKRRFGEKTFTQITGTRRDRIPELHKLLAPIMLRRTKDEVGHMLPKIFYSNIVVEEGKVDLDLDEDFVRWVFPNNRVAELEAKLKEEVALVKSAINEKDLEVLKGLAKSVSTLRRYIGIQKVEKVAELVTGELNAGLYDKIVIFAIHRSVVEGLQARLKDFNPVTLYAGTRFDTANKNIDKFQANERCKVFIGNITACGIAINLTAAHNVLMIEQEWTPAANAQAIARCHRHGQTKTVSVRMVGLANSLDEKISKILKKKTEELTAIFDTAKPVASELEDLLS